MILWIWIGNKDISFWQVLQEHSDFDFALAIHTMDSSVDLLAFASLAFSGSLTQRVEGNKLHWQ